MIDFAQKEYETEGLDFRLMDANKLDFNDKTFDDVVAYMLFNSLEHPEKLMNQVSRVIKKEGLFVIATLHPSYTSKKAKDTKFYLGHWDDLMRKDKYVKVYNHDLSDYLTIAEANGFELNESTSPLPPEELRDEDKAKYEERLRNPTFLIMKFKRM